MIPPGARDFIAGRGAVTSMITKLASTTCRATNQSRIFSSAASSRFGVKHPAARTEIPAAAVRTNLNIAIPEIELIENLPGASCYNERPNPDPVYFILWSRTLQSPTPADVLHRSGQ